MQHLASLTPPDEAFAYARLSDTLDNTPFPRTLRHHIGARKLGEFGAALMAERPVSADLSAHVARWRASDAARREDVPLRAHPDQTADDRRLRFAVAVTTIAFSSWIIIGIVAAVLAGKL